MPDPKRLLLFVEGEGDVEAVPVLVNRLLHELNPWDCLFLDKEPFRVHGVENLTGPKTAENWTRFLSAASRRAKLGGVLLLLDGDRETLPTVDGTVRPFCAKQVAQELAHGARAVGGGLKFSVAVVFARQEYESWLMAGVNSLAGKPLPEGRAGVRAGTTPPDGDLELAPRDAKRWLGRHMEAGYKPSLDQRGLTELVDLASIRASRPRSFRRLENAISQLVRAIRTGSHMVSPETKS